MNERPRPEGDPVTGDKLVVFTPSGRRGRFPVGTTVLDAARSLGVDIESACGGNAQCGRCQVELCEGEYPKHGVTSCADHLSALVTEEHERGLAPGRRLSCTARLLGDVVVDVPPASQVHRQVVRKAADARTVETEPAVRLYTVEVQQPDMHSPSGDLTRLEDALEFEHGLSGLAVDAAVLPQLQPALRAGAWVATVAVHLPHRTLIGIWPGRREEVYGLAVDVGSTTIAAHLCRLGTGEVIAAAGRMNPQIRFGEDLMSRVSYVMMHPGGEKELTGAVRAAVEALADEVARDAGIAREDIVDASFVGNPIMHHLLLGISPVELGGAPFALAVDRAVTQPAAELGLAFHPGARAYVLPCIAGHVGADTAGVLLAERPDLSDDMTLLVDVGTNAEIVLGNRRRLFACSSPTGPAFEGAQISCGQRAAPGAIERVRIDPVTLEPRIRVIGCELWSDEAGFAEAVAGTGITGICGSGIIEVIAEMYLAGIVLPDGTIDGALAERNARVRQDGRTYAYELVAGAEGRAPLCITQNDVRAIQLAKAALYAGVRLLMERAGIERVDRIRLAGAFGSHIDVKYAMILGLIPDCSLDHVSSAGNAAGTGARMALVDVRARREIENLVRRVEKIETAVEPRFQALFVDAMAIPHRTDPYETLRAAVTLPEMPTATAAEAPRGRRAGRRAVR
ncbi:ASKHA domain-containing protein [Azoarcus sp. KH32C]|uniref:ASKHA domain-containing protein n=1 Tax=Azoarcus sp. KH32C TaxID=748247 RepID=UPI0002385D76|nr:ASKHA domain-containing protein [Azoarcus sp. KH32C]BAL27046.1 ferredoxin, 2Fe-2S iron-sulfur cluster binding domain protein [Azoarcus sp. KH32C]